MPDQVELRFKKKRFDFWQRVNIRSSIDDLCTSVNLSVQQAGTRARLGFDENTTAALYINGQQITQTRADKVSRTITEDSHSIQFNARSLARELVDSQYSLTLKNQRLSEIVKRLATQFKVPLKVDASTAIVPDFSMQCESPASAVLNAARTGNVLIYPTSDGGLILTKATNQPPVATIAYGEAIKAYTLNDDYRLRFSEYLVKSFDHAANKSAKGYIEDPIFQYFRPYHIIADRHGNGLGALQRRAELEFNRRKSRAHSIELTLQGFGYQDQAGWHPWAVNTQVRVVIPDEDIDAVMLISDCEFSQDDQGGSITRLTVVDRHAFAGQNNTPDKTSQAARGARA